MYASDDCRDYVRRRTCTSDVYIALLQTFVL